MLMEAIAPASGKSIKLNVSLERCIIFSYVTMEDLACAIQEYETQNINKLWTGLFSEITTENGQTCLKAFSSRGSYQKNRFSFFPNELVREILYEPLIGKELVEYVQSRCIEGQRHILDTLYPRTRAELEETIRSPSGRFGCDKIALLDQFLSPDEFIDHIVEGLLYYKPTTYQNNEEFDLFNLLVFFWAKGWLLFPQNFRRWNLPSKWTAIYNANCKTSDTINKLYTTSHKDGRTFDRRLSLITGLFATSTTESINDLCMETISAYYDIIYEDMNQQYEDSKFSLTTPLGDLHKAYLCLSSAFNDVNPELAVPLRSRRSSKVVGAPRGDLHFKWIEQQSPELSEWAEYLHLYVLTITHAKIGPLINTLNTFIDFLITLNHPPRLPWLVSRTEHIYDARLINTNTFFNFLILKSNSGKSLKSILTHIRRFFLWLKEHLVAEGKLAESRFSDPILETDKLGVRINTGRTHREALPPHLVNEMKEILTEDDFRFPRTYAYSTNQTIDHESGYSVRVFNPGLSICMYTLLDTPVRSHQARWLDSGMLDEKVYSPETGEFKLNLSPYAIPKRKEGVLQLSTDALRSESWLTMWVNTNKTHVLEKTVGYTIPYVSPQLASLFQKQIEWSKRYLPTPKSPLNYKFYMQDVRFVREGFNLTGPEITPLFRDPSVPGQKLPFSYAKLSRYYVALLKETEKRFLEKYNQVIKLVTTNKGGKDVWITDLHSLRVSGITNLIEAGVPIEVVQQFVAGHKTLVMTLHYLKYSPAKLRVFIEEAHQRMQEDQDFVGSQGFIQAITEFTPFLLSQHGAGVGPGFEALNSGDGIMVINTDGICPGTSCSTGMLIKDRQEPIYGPVPGGKRCPLCRYWITGPAHLLGQVSAANNLAFAIRKKGLELARLNELKLDAEDSGSKRLARELRDRIDLLNRDIELDVAEWTARYKFLVESNAQMDEYLKAKENIIVTDASARVPMMTSSTALELKVTLEQAHEFALLDQITQTAAFNPGFPNLQAELEKTHVLSKMMVANGMKPFLLSLSDEQAREAGNLLSALVLQQVNAQDLDEVLTGKMALEKYPSLSMAVHALGEASSNEHTFLPNALTALTRLNDLSDSVAPSPSDQDGEDLFG